MDADGPSGDHWYQEEAILSIHLYALLQLVGFKNAPVTKFLVPVVGSCSALAIACNLKPHMALQLSHLGIENGQVKKDNPSGWSRLLMVV